MKVNIHGKGIIPGIGAIPPVFNQEMSEKEVARLLNFSNFKLYSADTKALITKKNYKSFFTDNTTTTVEVVKPEIVDTPVVDTAEDNRDEPESSPELIGDDVEETTPTVDEDTNETTETEEIVEDTNETVDETSNEESTEDTDETVDETPAEDKPNNNNYNNNHHRNKKKHNK